ncbi:MAG: PTS sugar transporter subunit IIA [Calditrichales bacterium]|nr:MAG: PTS sugar transporter subunit IIA [Calditrichales bacterium]
MKLSDYLPAEHIVHDLQGHTKIEVIEELLTCMKKAKLIDEFEVALNDVLDREAYLSTGLEHGLAIPHAKSESVSKLSIVFGLKKEGVQFDSLDGKPATLIFLVISPKDTSGPHIQALALITRNLKNAIIREKIKSCQSSEEIATLIREFD